MNSNNFGYTTAGTGWNYQQINPYNSHHFQPAQNIYTPHFRTVNPPYQYFQQLYPQQLYNNSYQPYYPQPVQWTQWNNPNGNLSVPFWNGMANNYSVPYPNYQTINHPPRNIIEGPHGILNNNRKCDNSSSDILRNETVIGKNYNVKKEDNEVRLSKEELKNFANIKKELQIIKGKFENVSKAGLESKSSVASSNSEHTDKLTNKKAEVSIDLTVESELEKFARIKKELEILKGKFDNVTKLGLVLKPSITVEKFINRGHNNDSSNSELNKKVEVSIDLTVESDDPHDRSKQGDKIPGYKLTEMQNSHDNLLNDVDKHIMNEKRIDGGEENQWILDISNLPKGSKIRPLGYLGEFMKSVIVSPEGKFFSSLDEAQRFINTKQIEIPNIVLDLETVIKEDDWVIDEINLPIGWKKKEQKIDNSNGIVNLTQSYKTADSIILKSDSDVLAYMRTSKTCSMRDIEKFMLSNEKAKPENNMSLKRQLCIDAEVGLNKRQKFDVKEMEEKISEDNEIKLDEKYSFMQLGDIRTTKNKFDVNETYDKNRHPDSDEETSVEKVMQFEETQYIKNRKCENIQQTHQNEETSKENTKQKFLSKEYENNSNIPLQELKELDEKEINKETEGGIDKGLKDLHNSEIERFDYQKSTKALLFQEKPDNLIKIKYLSEETLDTLYMDDEICNEYQIDTIHVPIEEIKTNTQLEYIEEKIHTQQDINFKLDRMSNENVKSDELVDEYIEETPAELENVNEKIIMVDKIDEKIMNDFVTEFLDRILTEK